MVKLNEKRVKWLVDQVVKYGCNPSAVASVYGLSVRRVQQLVKEYLETGKMPEIKDNRRPKVDLREEQKQLIEEVYEHHKVGARLLKIRKTQTKIPNTKQIHKMDKQQNTRRTPHKTEKSIHKQTTTRITPRTDIQMKKRKNIRTLQFFYGF